MATIRNLMAGALALLATSAMAAPERADERRAMVADVQQLSAAGAVGLPRQLSGRVLDAMGEVPRHLFVPQAEQDRAYHQTALEIGHEATISQPYIVALMTDLARVQPGERVLEVGTGSGYQAAILSRLGAQVHTIEIVPELAEQARARLADLGYPNIEVRAGDGYRGWPEAAPFDAILVTAGATHIPPDLVAQLSPGGRMVIPVGPDGDSQQLAVVTRDLKGRVSERRLGKVLFIPLVEQQP
ncbi:MAG TPA: protein-L-isoaspartate(D-aspartate) O-methyltransferase [Caulobacteraceae bacterium]|nr:protein-L-isoaspartate(D-aspartate) O-methyltransferase [Caulobacteraceae bacterium]